MKYELPKMNRREIIAGGILMPAAYLFLPILMGLAAMVIGRNISLGAAQMIFEYSCFFLTLVIFWDYLKKSYRVFAERFWLCLWSVFMGFLFISLASGFVADLVYYLAPQAVNGNEEAINAIAAESPAILFAASVLLAPLVEETIFRGLLFGNLVRINRFLAYVVMVAAFGLFHVVSTMLSNGDLTQLVFVIAYIPASVGLAWVFERTGTIWTPVFLHMLYNYVGVSVRG